MDVSIQQLRMLREVAKQGTIAAAAQQLGYTASAVSQQLAAVERITGIAVLERVGRNVLLTDAGRELVRHAELILAQLEEAKAAVERVGQTVSGTLQIGLMESVASTILPPLFQRLGQMHPDLIVRTRQIDPDEAMHRVRAGELDLAFSVDYPNSPSAKDAQLDRTLVCRDWYRLVVPATDVLSSQVVVDLADMVDRPLITSPPGLACGRCVVQACRDAGFEPDIAHELDDYPTVLHLVAAGAGSALVPELGLQRLPEGLHVLELKTPVCRTLELVHRASSAARPAVAAVVDAVSTVADELGLDR